MTAFDENERQMMWGIFGELEMLNVNLARLTEILEHQEQARQDAEEEEPRGLGIDCLKCGAPVIYDFYCNDCMPASIRRVMESYGSTERDGQKWRIIEPAMSEASVAAARRREGRCLLCGTVRGKAGQGCYRTEVTRNGSTWAAHDWPEEAPPPPPYRSDRL